MATQVGRKLNFHSPGSSTDLTPRPAAVIESRDFKLCPKNRQKLFSSDLKETW